MDELWPEFNDEQIQDMDEWIKNNGLENFEFDPNLVDLTADSLFIPEEPTDAEQMFPIADVTDQVPELAPLDIPQQPAPTMPQPDMAADTSLGPSWDPRIGWYYPLVGGPGSIPPTPMSAMPPRAPAPAPARHNPRRKYGPAAYLEEQERQRAFGNTAPRDVSISQAVYKGKPGPKPKHPLRNRKRTNIVQACVCNTKKADIVKRPKNAFILYRSAKVQEISSGMRVFNNQDVSKIAGRRWRNETPEVKAKFEGLADEEAIRHRKENPDYKYQPGAAERAKFGSTSCRCGAYHANLTAMRKDHIADLEEAEADHVESEVDEYVPPRRNTRTASRVQAHPPAAETYAPIPDTSLFNFSTPAQQKEAAEYAANLKRKRETQQAQSAFQESNEEPLAKRRTTRRCNKKSVSYVDPDENDIYMYTPENSAMPGYMPADYVAPAAPMVPEEPATIAPADLQLLQDFVPEPEPEAPAYNTRARSKSISPQVPQTEFNFDFGVDDFGNEVMDWDELFAGQTVLLEEDNIVVAPRRTSKSSQVEGAPTMRTRSQSQSVEPESPKQGGLRRSSRKSSSR